jgi:hypothetical protein
MAKRWGSQETPRKVITQDRSSLYADGGRQGAPSAVQITDSYYLVSNLSEAVERDIQQLQIDARKQLAQKAKRANQLVVSFGYIVDCIADIVTSTNQPCPGPNVTTIAFLSVARNIGPVP